MGVWGNGNLELFKGWFVMRRLDSLEYPALTVETMANRVCYFLRVYLHYLKVTRMTLEFPLL